MLALPEPCVVCLPEEPFWSTVEKLSSCWLKVDWKSWPAPSREVAKTLVSIGAIELRIKCTLRKQGVASPLLVSVWGTGDFWAALKTELTSIAETAARWKGQLGEIHVETVKEAIRWSLEGEKAWRTGKLDLDEREQWLHLSPARLEVESCQFSDDTPYSGGTKREDPLAAPIVTWSLGSEAHPTNAAVADAIEKPGELMPHWTQAELDVAIQALRDDPRIEYELLRDLIYSGSKAAKAKAKEIFGRNALARRFKVRGAAMVSRSSVWRTIATELDLIRGKIKPIPLANYVFMPVEDALEARADLDPGSVLADLTVEETQRRIKRLVAESDLKFPSQRRAEDFLRRIDAVIALLDTGRYSPHKAIELTKESIASVREEFKRKIHQRP